MIKAKSIVKFNMPVINRLTETQVTALEQTAELLHEEVQQAQVMPFGESITVEKRVYGVRGQFAKTGREYKGKTVRETMQRGGNLQNESTFVDKTNSKEGKVSIVSSTPYARRLYYHPEYNFYKGENPNAGGKWYDPWISGQHKDFCQNAFAQIYRRLAGL